MRRSLTASLCALALVGCSLNLSGLAEDEDGGGGMDAGPAGDVDGGGSDPDGGDDAGSTDGGGGDGGPVVLDDGGMTDAGMIDAGMIDAGMIDAGMIDAGMPDAGMPDAGPTPCNVQYAGVPGVVHCAERATECEFYADLNGTYPTCAAVCMSFGPPGAMCLRTYGEGSPVCTRDTGVRACTTTHNDEICVCSR